MKMSKASWVIIMLFVVLLCLSGYFNLLNYFRHYYLQFPFPEDAGRQRARDDYDCGRVWLIAPGDFSGSYLHEETGLFFAYESYVDDSITGMNEITFSLAYNTYVLSRIMSELRDSLYKRFAQSVNWKEKLLEEGRTWRPGEPDFEWGHWYGEWLVRRGKGKRRWIMPVDSNVAKIKYLYQHPLIIFGLLSENDELLSIYVFWNEPLLLLRRIYAGEDKEK